MPLFHRRRSGPGLSPETLRRLNILFPPVLQERAAELLANQCGRNLPFCEAFDGLVLLEGAVQLAQED